ncbi:MAG TPA: PadR family transcriptional regulator [Pseudonocardiaceae bacterium]|jgi:DNA-binding PadR family transcriptional regulator|nr:PadR family transcriptional regulator [Pseudonocardiaceae bacterium]
MSLRHALLGLLQDHPASGYDLLHLFNTSLANVWPATQSQVYGELVKLTDAGLLAVGAEGPRGRKEYSITEPGRAELVHWLVETEPTQVPRSESLLRVFFLGNLTAAEAQRYLRKRETTAEGAHAQLRGIEQAISGDDADLAVYGRVALEYGLRFSAMERDWARWAQAEVARIKQAGTPAD